MEPLPGVPRALPNALWKEQPTHNQRAVLATCRSRGFLLRHVTDPRVRRRTCYQAGVSCHPAEGSCQITGFSCDWSCTGCTLSHMTEEEKQVPGKEGGRKPADRAITGPTSQLPPTEEGSIRRQRVGLEPDGLF